MKTIHKCFIGSMPHYNGHHYILERYEQSKPNWKIKLDNLVIFTIRLFCPAKPKGSFCMLSCKVSRYCLLALHCSFGEGPLENIVYYCFVSPQNAIAFLLS